MRVPLSLSLSLLFLAVSSCFSSGSETDRFEEKKRAIKETQPPQTHKLAEQKTSSSRIRFIIIIIVVIIIIIIIIIIVTAVPVFHVFGKNIFSSCLLYSLYFLTFSRKTPSKKKSRSTRVRVSHRAKRITLHPKNRSSSEQEEDSSACAFRARARVYIIVN